MENVGEIVKAAGAGPLAFLALGILVLAYLSSKWFGADGVRVKLAIFLLIFGLICLAPFVLMLLDGGRSAGETGSNEAVSVTDNRTQPSNTVGSTASPETSPPSPAVNTSEEEGDCPVDFQSPAAGRNTTEEACLANLKRLAASKESAVLACTPALRGHANQLTAAAALAENIGERSYCSSTVARNFQAGRWSEACNVFQLFNKREGETDLDLVKRRLFERSLCLENLPSSS